jgi:hypothetical protein
MGGFNKLSDGLSILVLRIVVVKRPGLSQPVQVAGLPRAAQLAQLKELAVKYQRVYPLTPENVLPYKAMTYLGYDLSGFTKPLANPAATRRIVRLIGID